MPYPKRRPNRLKGYDYSSNGAYFVTICTKDRENLFWEDTENNFVGADIIRPTYKPQLSPLGKIVDIAINNIPKCYNDVIVEKYVIMPNHIHMLIFIQSYADGRMISAPTLSRVIGQFKRWVSKQYGKQVFQRSFHDHIVRNDKEYNLIWRYIDANPQLWEMDCFYTQ